MSSQTTTYPIDSPQARELIHRASLAEMAADRAFRRWFTGEVQHATGAGRLASVRDEAWADVRIRVQYGDLIEACDWRGVADALHEGWIG